MAGARIMTVGPKKVKAKKQLVNGVSLEGSQKAMTRMAGKSGFGYQGAQISARGR